MESTVHYTSEEPEYMHYHELQAITEFFKNELGRGGFGAVYKGKCKDKEVAVKVLLERSQGNQDNEFKLELLNLVNLSHPNIIQLVGYCCETYEKFDRWIGKLEPVTRTALCFEYAPNGNLRKYTFDEHRLDWHKVYNIIKGTCKGLYYLHHHSSGYLWHLDLKPENILLDHNMDPKIADFGLSKLFTSPTTKVLQIGGTTDYVPPEYKLRGQVTRKFDIFSLGVIIIEVMAGIGTYRIIDDFDSYEDVIKIVLEKWNNILSGYCKQVKACIEIALKCVDIKPKNRPELTDIIDELNKVENVVPPIPLSQNSSKYEGSSTGETSQGPESKLLLSVHPLELHFSLGLGANRLMNSRPLHLTNNTDNRIVYRVLTKHPKEHFEGLLCGIVLPMSTCTLVVSIREQLELSSDNDEFFILESIVAHAADMDDLRSYKAAEQYDLFYTEAKQKGRAVQQVKLTAAYIWPEPEKKVYEPMMITYKIPGLVSIDAHPTEPWIVMGKHGNPCVYIWDYQTQEVKSFSITPPWSQGGAVSVKFIPSKQWIVVGSTDGPLYVYNYEREEDVRTVDGHSFVVTTLETHATEPYVLSASHDGTVRLWNYEKDWELMKTIPVNRPDSRGALRYVAFDPKGADEFAIADGSTVQIWNWNSDEPKLTLSGPGRVSYLDYCSSGGELIACCYDYPTTSKIWDYHTGKCVHELALYTSYTCAVCSHSDLPILITGSSDGSVRVWHTTNFRLMGRLNLDLGYINDLQCLKDSRRIMIACSQGLALVEIDMIMGRA